jgi:hypothetical protein
MYLSRVERKKERKRPGESNAAKRAAGTAEGRKRSKYRLSRARAEASEVKYGSSSISRGETFIGCDRLMYLLALRSRAGATSHENKAEEDPSSKILLLYNYLKYKEYSKMM